MSEHQARSVLYKACLGEVMSLKGWGNFDVHNYIPFDPDLYATEAWERMTEGGCGFKPPNGQCLWGDFSWAMSGISVVVGQ